MTKQQHCLCSGQAWLEGSINVFSWLLSVLPRLLNEIFRTHLRTINSIKIIIMGQTKSQNIPLLLLADDAVLLPGTTLRIPVAGGSDVSALLTSLFTRAKSPKPDPSTMFIGCVPLNSALLSADGQRLITGEDGEDGEEPSRLENNLENATKKDLFSFGTVAKISGVQGRRTNELALILEGTRRFRIQNITQIKPFFEARVALLDEDGLLF